MFESNTEFAVNGVWQSLRDAELIALTPARFHELTADVELSDEEREAAWADFEDRRGRVFAAE